MKVLKPRWTDEEIKFLRDHYPTMTAGEMAKHIDRSEHKIREKARLMGISKQTHERWTPEEIEFLAANWQYLSLEQLARELGKPVISCRSVAKRMRLGSKTKIRGLAEPAASNPIELNIKQQTWIPL